MYLENYVLELAHRIGVTIKTVTQTANILEVHVINSEQAYALYRLIPQDKSIRVSFHVD